MTSPEKSLQDRVAHWIRPEILNLEAYHVPPAEGLIKLDAMENPYPLPQALRQAWLQRLGSASLNRYPDPAAQQLRARIIEVFGVPRGARVLLGNGSDEIIQILVQALGGSGRTLLTPEPGFAMFRLIAEASGTRHVGVALREGDFELDAGAMLDAIERHRPALIFLAHPNNPTGNLFDPQAMRAVVEAAPGVVVIDEAYSPFAGRSCLHWLDEYPHLLVLRTLSKMGLAGLRLGWLAGDPCWLRELDKLRLPYNINTLTQLSGELILSRHAALDAQAKTIVAERERLGEALACVDGVQVYPSAANFLLFRVFGLAPDAVRQALRRAGILIKDVSASHPLVAGCLRVTVGTPAQNESFVRALAQALPGQTAACLDNSAS